ncbi:MAG: hypothetical protein M1480_01645 [Bacteroidetes bacterium]|nr:hypothetical protein [Bacteroidota bacterium]
MPYRELPKSDAGKEDALQIIYGLADAKPASELAFSQANGDKVKVFYPIFKKEIKERGNALSAQSEATTVRAAAEGKCKTYVSHFYQVFNLGVDRDEHKASERAFYKLDVSQETVPLLNNADDIRRNAENIITGEAERVNAGGAPMSNPSKDQVEAAYNDFAAKLKDQTDKKSTYSKEQKDVDDIRAQADELIKDVWDEVEFYYRKLSSAAMRREARIYGVVYVSRPGEPVEEVTPPAPEQPVK